MTTSFSINGTPYKVNLTNFPPDITLNTFIREHAQLTATKFMCLEGGCGACVVVVKGKHPNDGAIKTWAVNSCLTLLNTCADWEITTAEGIGNKRVGYHPIQKRLAKMNGTQCGYCSPGFVMNMYGLLESKRDGKVTMAEVENAFGGNICRCTGYRPILDAMKSFAADSTIQLPPECSGDIEDCGGVMKKCAKTGLQCAGACKNTLTNLLYDDGTQWYWPKTLEDLFKILAAIPSQGGDNKRRRTVGTEAVEAGEEFMLVAGNTAHGVYRRSLDIKHFIDIHAVPELKQYSLDSEKLTLGANLSLSETMDIFVEAAAAKAGGYEYCQQLWQHFDLIANVPVRNIMPRAQNAHAYVNGAFLLGMADIPTGQVNSARICFGGINPNFTHATALESALAGRNLFEKATLAELFKRLQQELEPNAVLPDPSPEYRKALACGMLYRSLLKLAPADKVNAAYKSGAELLKRPLSSGMQSFETIEKNYPLTQAVEKVEAMIQCSGEATYMNDILTTSNTVYCAFAHATKVGANIEEIDASAVLKTPGVIAFYTAKDIPGANRACDPTFGFDTEEIFCSGIVKYYNEPLGVVVAITSDIANRAASKVKVTYSSGGVEMRTILPTIEHVFQAQECFINNANTNKSEGADVIKAKGIFEIGGQYHFTMEPQTTVAMPFEEGLKVWSATQWMDHTQSVIAKMLQVKAKDVQLQVRRLGGGYGAKITRGNQVACAAALAAYKLNRPTRFVQTIESMMYTMGKRWGCRSDYEVQVKATNGKIVSLTNKFYQDAGYTANESPVAQAAGHAKSCYELDEASTKIAGEAVLTDAPSSTWCRAPGSVEGVAMIENILEHLAFEANIDPADARLANLKAGNKMEQLLPRFLTKTEYRQRRKEVDAFNERNRWIKRGLGLAIMEYPVHLFGQYPATVAIYHVDGTVVISHGGIEMGQGMNTKIAQVAAYTLGIPMSYIQIESSDTINGANSMVTGGAVGSESLCFAVRKACETLNERLQPVKDAIGGGKETTPDWWLKVVQQAWLKAINMIASEHYKQGDMENYSVFGLALTELEVDILTGNHQIKRVDILEDAGESLSPHIDVGQVEGGFVMLLGYWLTEQLVFDRQNGQLLTNRTWTYKPPGAKDIPIDFRIELLQKNPNPAGFLRSKATGEPPCCLAVSSIFAVQHALQSARKDAGLKREWVRLGAPTTPETIFLNAGMVVSMFSLV